MKANASHGLMIVLLSAALSACTSQGGDSSANLAAALASADRPEADKARDADRKPAELLQFFGVKPGMTTADILALGGYVTEALSVAVGPNGKVYAQNPPFALQLRDGVYAKEITERLADDRLKNVVRVDADLPASAQIPPGSVDVAVTAMNYHDVRNRDPDLGVAFLKSIYTILKPGGVLGVTDHIGNDGANNAELHRIPEHLFLEDAKAAGFTVDARSDMLAHATDDHTKMVFDPALRGRTDQFVVRLRKPM
jgi:predicted methyltransferase